jgi:hypothetical protein
MSDLQQAVDQVRNARWEAWKRMAKKLPDRHILSVELFRTEQDETLAVFTVVRNGRPVQEVLRANSRGVGVKAVVFKDQHKCEPIQVWPMHHVEAVKFEALAAAPSDDVVANGIPLGEPPPKQDPEPGVISLATVMLPSAFDVGERLTESARTERK